MKSPLNQIGRRNSVVPCLLALSVLGVRLLQPATASESSSKPPPEFQIDDSSPARNAHLPASLAAVVKKVAPSVVSVFTTKKVSGFRLEDAFPFFDDPIFRRWSAEGEESRFANPPRPQVRTERGLGSGVILTKDGYILTANHVVDGADEIKVALADEQRRFVAHVIGRDPQTDVALLKIDASDLPAVTLTDSDKLAVGDAVLTLGNPFGVGQAVSHGIISAVGRGGLGIEPYENFIQTDAPINPGYSGGALVDIQGRLIGINTAISTRAGAHEGVGFAFPINLARGVMDKLLKEGSVMRGFLGVGIQDLTPELAREFDAPDTKGILIGSVEPNGAAAAAGLESGDVIIAFNGTRFADNRQFRLLVAQTKPGTQAGLKILRQGKPKTLTATLKESPAPKLSVIEAGPNESAGEVLKDVAVSDLKASARRQFGIPDEVKGVLATEVPSESIAFEAGLRVGDVIQEINKKPVGSVEDEDAATRHVSNQRVLLRVWRQNGSRFLVVDEEKSGAKPTSLTF